MAKKSKQPQQIPLSPNKYISLKARSLPIVQCTINDDWQDSGIAMIIVARQHKSGNYTLGGYLVDIHCLGVKDTYYYFNIFPEEYAETIEAIPSGVEITYEEAHNIIYGAIAFAEEEAGIQPHPEFRLTQYLLEEDTEKIPLIEYEFGENGKPVLWTTTRSEAKRYLPMLRQKLGEDFEYHIREEEEYDEVYKDIESNLTPEGIRDLMQKMQQSLAESKALPHMKYSYVHPNYPLFLQLKYNELTSLYDKKNYYSLPETVIDAILALPRKELTENLNDIILYELGISCGTITNDMYEKCTNTLTHVLFLIGELKATECLPAILEIFRQNESAFNYHFGDARRESFQPTLYQISRDRMEVLLDFMKEPGLNEYAKAYIAETAIYVSVNEPERRHEMIDWHRRLLSFMKEHAGDNSVYDASLMGMIISGLINIKATELLPEIKVLYDARLVDTMCCGSYAKVEDKMMEQCRHISENYSLPTIYERYINYERVWKR